MADRCGRRAPERIPPDFVEAITSPEWTRPSGVIATMSDFTRGESPRNVISGTCEEVLHGGQHRVHPPALEFGGTRPLP